MKGRDILNRNGFQATVERIPHIGGGAGCGYGIEVSPEGLAEAEALLGSGNSVCSAVRNGGEMDMIYLDNAATNPKPSQVLMRREMQ